MVAPFPPDEADRLDALHAQQILDTPPDPLFDKFVLLAAQIMETPIGLISLIDADRQWFKARCGLGVPETPRDVAFCAHAILSDEPLIVEDASRDPRFADNPLVLGEPHIRFYAGAPLTTSAGYRLGTLCAIDVESHRPTPEQVAALRTLASIVADTLRIQSDSRRLSSQLTMLQPTATREPSALPILLHELRTPLTHIIGFAQILEQDEPSRLSAEKSREYCSIIKKSGQHLFRLIEKMSNTDQEISDPAIMIADIDIIPILNEVVRAFKPTAFDRGQTLAWNPLTKSVRVLAEPTAFRQVAINLLSNACRYSPDEALIRVNCQVDEYGAAELLVTDTGPGIPEEVLNRLGQAYLQHPDPAQRVEDATGLGLRISLQLANAMGHELVLRRLPEGGTEASLIMPVSGRRT